MTDKDPAEVEKCRTAFEEWVTESGADFALEKEHDDLDPNIYADSATADAFDGFQAAYAAQTAELTTLQTIRDRAFDGDTNDLQNRMELREPLSLADQREVYEWLQEKEIILGDYDEKIVAREAELATAKAEVVALRVFDLLTDFRDNHIPWSTKTFGDGFRWEGICKHIESELCEIRARPTNVTEWMDVVILALDGAWRAGYTAGEVLSALLGKMKIIRDREYSILTGDDEPCFHVKPADQMKGGRDG